MTKLRSCCWVISKSVRAARCDSTTYCEEDPRRNETKRTHPRCDAAELRKKVHVHARKPPLWTAQHRLTDEPTHNKDKRRRKNPQKSRPTAAALYSCHASRYLQLQRTRTRNCTTSLQSVHILCAPSATYINSHAPQSMQNALSRTRARRAANNKNTRSTGIQTYAPTQSSQSAHAHSLASISSLSHNRKPTHTTQIRWCTQCIHTRSLEGARPRSHTH